MPAHTLKSLTVRCGFLARVRLEIAVTEILGHWLVVRLRLVVNQHFSIVTVIIVISPILHPIAILFTVRVGKGVLQHFLADDIRVPGGCYLLLER